MSIPQQQSSAETESATPQQLENELSLQNLMQENSDAERILSSSNVASSQLRGEIETQTRNQIEADLTALGESTPEQIEIEANQAIEGYEETMDRLVAARGNSEEINQVLDDLRLQIRREEAMDQARVIVGSPGEDLAVIITSVPVVQRIMALLPDRARQEVDEAINNSDFDQLETSVGRIEEEYGFEHGTIAHIGMMGMDETEESSGFGDRMLSLIEGLPFAGAISAIISNNDSLEHLDMYSSATDALGINLSAITPQLVGQTIGQLMDWAQLIDSSQLDPQDPNDARISQVLLFANHVTTRDNLVNLWNSFETQIRSDEAGLTEQEANAVLTRMSVENLSVAAATAFLYGNERLQQQWYFMIPQYTRATSNAIRTLFTRRYAGVRRIGLSKAMRLFNGTMGSRRAPLRAFTQAVSDLNLNVAINPNATTGLDDAMDGLDRSLFGLSDPQGTSQLTSRLNDPNLGLRDSSRNIAQVGELVDTFNEGIRQWDGELNRVGRELVGHNQQLDRIFNTLDNNRTISDVDLDFVRSMYGHIPEISTINNRNDLIGAWGDPNTRALMETDFVRRMENFRSLQSRAQDHINGHARNLNDTVVTPHRAHLDDIEGFARGTAASSDELVDAMRHQKRHRILGAIPLVGYAGLTLGTQAVAVARGESTLETAALQVGATAVYFIPVVGTVVSVFEAVRGRTIAGFEMDHLSGEWWAHVGFTGLQLVSDFANLLGGAGVGMRAAIASTRTATGAARASRAMKGAPLLMRAGSRIGRFAGRFGRASRVDDAARLLNRANDTRGTVGGFFLRGRSALRSRIGLGGNVDDAVRFLSKSDERLGIIDDIARYEGLRDAASATGRTQDIARANQRLIVLRGDGRSAGGLLQQADSALEAMRAANPEAARRALAAPMQMQGGLTARIADRLQSIEPLRRGVMRLEQAAGIAAFGSVAAGMLISASDDEMGIVRGTGRAAGRAYDATSGAAGWVLGEHQRTDYQTIIDDVIAETRNQTAFLEANDGASEDELLEAYARSLQVPGIYQLAIQQEVLPQVNAYIAQHGARGLEEAISGDSGSTDNNPI